MTKATPPLGATCVSEHKKVAHALGHPDYDADLQSVRNWLSSTPELVKLIGDAVEDSMYYVLDGWRTHRFDLLDPRVDSDELRGLGAKLQYHILDNLKLPKVKPLDTTIDDIAVDIKGTVHRGKSFNWAIPREAQCEICILVQLDSTNYRHRTSLMRTHRLWLNEGVNGDKKRGITKAAFDSFAIPLYDWTDLRPNPLRLLSETQRDVVFGKRGQEFRLQALFRAVPKVPVPRAVILTVCANKDDPLRRVRAIRERMMEDYGLVLLCGKWVGQREMGTLLGYDLTGAAWVAVPRPDIENLGTLTELVWEEINDPSLK